MIIKERGCSGAVLVVSRSFFILATLSKNVLTLCHPYQELASSILCSTNHVLYSIQDIIYNGKTVSVYLKGYENPFVWRLSSNLIFESSPIKGEKTMVQTSSAVRVLSPSRAFIATLANNVVTLSYIDTLKPYNDCHSSSSAEGISSTPETRIGQIISSDTDSKKQVYVICDHTQFLWNLSGSSLIYQGCSARGNKNAQ